MQVRSRCCTTVGAGKDAGEEGEESKREDAISAEDRQERMEFRRKNRKIWCRAGRSVSSGNLRCSSHVESLKLLKKPERCGRSKAVIVSGQKLAQPAASTISSQAKEAKARGFAWTAANNENGSTRGSPEPVRD